MTQQELELALERVTSERDALAAAMAKYGYHDIPCNSEYGYECTCGWSEVQTTGRAPAILARVRSDAAKAGAVKILRVLYQHIDQEPPASHGAYRLVVEEMARMVESGALPVEVE